MIRVNEVIEGLGYSWEYIKDRPNPTATPKASAMHNIQTAIDSLREQQKQIENLIQTAQSMMEGIVVSQPQIVRCRDCKYAEVDMCCSHPSEWNNSETRNHNNPDFFCADGERRDSP